MESIGENAPTDWEASKTLITEGPLKGYYWHPDADPFETLAGPMGYRLREDGKWESAFYSERKHCNGHGNLHGGMLMTFADFSLFSIASDVLNGPCVTVSFTSEFTAGQGVGNLILSDGEVIRNTRSLVFVRGTIHSEGQILLNYSGIVKRLGGRPNG